MLIKTFDHDLNIFKTLRTTSVRSNIFDH